MEHRCPSSIHSIRRLRNIPAARRAFGLPRPLPEKLMQRRPGSLRLSVADLCHYNACYSVKQVRLSVESASHHRLPWSTFDHGDDLAWRRLGMAVWDAWRMQLLGLFTYP
jgi:hypothetical protein